MPNAPSELLSGLAGQEWEWSTVCLQLFFKQAKPSGQPVFTNLTISSRAASCVFAIWERYASITACVCLNHLVTASMVATNHSQTTTFGGIYDFGPHLKFRALCNLHTRRNHSWHRMPR
ncbi:unnamed protein product [Fusarium graminearum]|uniref:Uncharacterized protein n=1 Tax=Gibberella zeae TaxID=5518 RepID=A0A4E9DJR9_GIBZA|nr:unnamed protein product [Fusarium graminearum]CAG1992477.1 unnamed protein product [Fusarium graminearum]CAG1992862.1 unnamed protein product [Fusarium graminearum]